MIRKCSIGGGSPGKPIELVPPPIVGEPKSAQNSPARLGVSRAVGCFGKRFRASRPNGLAGALLLNRNRSFGGKHKTLGRDVNRRQSGGLFPRNINAID